MYICCQIIVTVPKNYDAFNFKKISRYLPRRIIRGYDTNDCLFVIYFHFLLAYGFHRVGNHFECIFKSEIKTQLFKMSSCECFFFFLCFYYRYAYDQILSV